MFLKKEWSSEINLDYTWTSLETSFKYSMMDRGQEGCDNCGTQELHVSSSPSRLRGKKKSEARVHWFSTSGSTAAGPREV